MGENGQMSRTATVAGFIGREDELSRLAALRTEAAGGAPTAVLVGGDAGVGKTRLVGELVAAARGDGFLTLFGQCMYLGGETMPYAPVIEMLRNLAIAGREDAAPLITTAETELLRLVPQLDPGRAVPDGDPQPIRLFEQMLALVRRLSQDRPVLLIVEDLHWADESTRALLAFLLRHLRVGRLMMVGTYRSDELHRRHPLRRWLSELDRGVRPDWLDLRPFTAPELRRLLVAISGQQVAPETAKRIHDQSGGNAFYAELLFAHVYGRHEATSLEEAVRGRLTDLTDESWSLLCRAAAFRRIEPTMLAAISRRSEEEVDAALRHLVDRGVLVTVAGDVRFSHEMVREVLYDSLLPGERVRVHRQIAEELESSAGSVGAVAAELAHHWCACGVAEKALQASVLAIGEAMRLSAVAEACIHCERAFELWEQVADPEEVTGTLRRDLVLSYADAAFLNGTPQQAIALLRTELAGTQPGDPALAPLYERLVSCARIAQDPEALAVAEEAADRTDGVEPTVRARLLRVTAGVALLTGRFDRFEQVTAEGLAAAREAGDDACELAIMIDRGYALGIQGRSEGLRLLAELVERLATTGERDAWYRTLTSFSFCTCIAGRPEETLERCGEGLSQFGQSASVRAEFKAYRMGALRWLGRWDELVAEADSVAFDLEVLGWSDLLGAALAPVLVERGEFERARPMLTAAWEKVRRTPLHALAVPSTAVAAAMAAVYDSRHSDAFPFITRAVDLVAGSWSVRLPELVAVGARAAADHAQDARMRHEEDNSGEAMAYASTVLAYLAPALADERVDIGHCREQMRAWSEQAHAELDRAHGLVKPESWLRLASLWPGLHRPEQAAYCHYRAAESLLRATPCDRQQAGAALASAYEIAYKLGARPLLRDVETLATRSRTALLTAPDSPRAKPMAVDAPFGLTSREREVLGLVARGHTNRHIGEELVISAKTVSTHVSRILNKMDVDSRSEAARTYHRLGMGSIGEAPKGPE
jgi:DNA-binding CsgD family transcriptional regulator